MRNILTTVIVGLVCLIVGLAVGTFQSSQLKSSSAGQLITSAAAKLQSGGSGGDDNQIESNEYPTLKWKGKPLSESADAIARLSTTFESGPNKDAQGTLKYKLDLYKASNKDSREVQLLDTQGFKLMQFTVGDFQDIPGAPNIKQARDGFAFSESDYKKIRDYSVK